MRVKLAFLGVAAALFTLLTPAFAAPEPEVIPRRWQLNVEVDDLRAVSIDVPGVGPQAFYYLTYTVTNNSGEDVQFYPSFTLATDDGTIIKSNRGVPKHAKDELLRQAGRGRLDLVSELDAQGLLLQGKENARESIVIWPCLNLSVNEVKAYLGGFSGETRAVTRPDTGGTEILRKELMLVHEVLGTIDLAARKPLNRIHKQWILR